MAKSNNKANRKKRNLYTYGACYHPSIHLINHNTSIFSFEQQADEKY